MRVPARTGRYEVRRLRAKRDVAPIRGDRPAAGLATDRWGAAGRAVGDLARAGRAVVDIDVHEPRRRRVGSCIRNGVVDSVVQDITPVWGYAPRHVRVA